MHTIRRSFSFIVVAIDVHWLELYSPTCLEKSDILILLFLLHLLAGPLSQRDAIRCESSGHPEVQFGPESHCPVLTSFQESLEASAQHCPGCPLLPPAGCRPRRPPAWLTLSSHIIVLCLFLPRSLCLELQCMDAPPQKKIALNIDLFSILMNKRHK